MADLESILINMIEDHNRLAMQFAEAQRKMDAQVRHGKVTDVDNKHKDGPRFRMEIGEKGGKPVKSPWLKQTQFAGDFKKYTPLVKDQQMTVFSPNGEIRQGLIIPYGWRDKFKAPSDKDDEHVDAYGEKLRNRWKKDEFIEQTVGKSKVAQKADGTFRVSAADKNEPKDKNGAKADDDAHNESGSEGVLLELNKEKFEIKRGNASLLIQDGKILLKVGGATVELVPASVETTAPTIAEVASSAFVTTGPNYLGQDGKASREGQFVETQGGPSTTVKAKV